MRPHEFFDLTPGEVTSWLMSKWRGVLRRTYYEEGVRRKPRLPASADDLFPKKSNEILDGEDMLVRLKSIAKESKRLAALKDARTQEVRK